MKNNDYKFLLIILNLIIINLTQSSFTENKIILSKNQKIVITSINSVENLALSLYAGLKDIGFNNVFISDIIYKNDEETLYIIFPGAFIDNKNMPKNYILYQSEQIGSSWFNENYIKNIREAKCVLDYSWENIKYLNNKFNFDIMYLPFNYHPISQKSPLCYCDKSYQADSLRDIDVLFLGALNERRLVIQNELEKLGLKILFLNYVPLPELYELIKRAKVVLNLHYYNQKTILETSRLSLLWSNQACVLTETSDDQFADETFKKCAFFSEYKNIATNCKKLVDDLETRIKIAQSGHNIFTKNHLLIDDLKNIFIVAD